MKLSNLIDTGVRITIHTSLGAIRHTENGAEVVWGLPAGYGVVTTNLATVNLPDGRLAIGLGRNDEALRVWGL